MKKNFNQIVLDAFSANKTSYDEYQNLLMDFAEGRDIYDEDGNKVSKADANDKIMAVQFAILELPEKPNKRDIARAMRKHGAELYEVIEDTIDIQVSKGWKESDFFNRFTETINTAEGDKNEFFVEDKCILAVSKVSGHHHDVSLQTLPYGSTFSVKTSSYTIGVGASLELFLLGKIDWQKFIAKCSEAYIIKLQNEAVGQIMDYDKQTAIPEAFKGNGELNADTKADFDEVCSNVAGVNDSDIYIMGSKNALKHLTNLGKVEWMSEDEKRDLYHTGRIGDYEGTPLVEIPQRIDPEETFNGKQLKKLVPDDVLLIMSTKDDKFVKHVDEGDTLIFEEGKERGENNLDIMGYVMQRTMGIATMLGQYHGYWKI